MKNSWLCLPFILAGCATPNAPGQGVGSEYTPIVDMQGVDGTRYMSDLSACRQYAVQIDPTREMVAEGVGQAIFSAVIMQAAGGSNRQIARSANVGANAGIWRGQGQALGTQQRIVANCLASRNYRVLDGTAQVTFTQAIGAPMPPPATLPEPAAAAAAPTAQPVAYRPPGLVTLPTGAGNPPPTVEPSGKDAYVAERLARELKCNDTTLSKLVGKGAGYESYSMACTNGETLLIRCEFGTCRALR